MNIWKQRFINIIYFHHRIVAMLVIFASGCVAVYVIYEFLFAEAPPINPTEEQAGVVMVNKKALERVSKWSEAMREKSAFTITVPNEAFEIPTPVPTP
jgi:hypothetical protein